MYIGAQAMTLPKAGSNGNGNGSVKWEEKEHNRLFSRLFKRDVVDEVKKVDLLDKEDYDAYDNLIEKVRQARTRLRANIPRCDDEEKS